MRVRERGGKKREKGESEINFVSFLKEYESVSTNSTKDRVL